jgi:hypothetical protein
MTKAVLLATTAALVLPAPSVAMTGQIAGGSTSFSDSRGELAAGPDIATVTVSNDDSGVLTFAVAVPNRPTLVGGMSIEILLNTDLNAGTGSVDHNGAEYFINYESGRRPDLGKWDGAHWNFSVPGGSLKGTYDGGATLKIATSDLGGTKAFKFYADASQHQPEGQLDVDFAPDVEPGWAYAVHIAPPGAKPSATTTGATTTGAEPAKKPVAKKPAKKKKKK